MTVGLTTGKRESRRGRDAYLAACAMFGLKPARKPRDDKEYRLQCKLADDLRAYGRRNVFWTSIPMGEKRSAVSGARVKASGGRAGSPDLIFVIKGHVYGLELKALDGDKPTDLQLAAGELLGRAGGTYAVAKGYDAAVAYLVAWGALPAGFDTRSSRRLQIPLGLEA